MKTNLTSESSLLALLMVVLLLSSPLATLAQQISAERQAKQDAERQAKQDAEADLNKLLWIGTGFAVPLLPILGLLVGSLGPQSVSSGDMLSLSCQQGCGFFVGCAVGCLVPLTLIRRYQPTPPSERFIGKSPEYVDAYTDAYKTRTRSRRIHYTATGVASYMGIVVIGGMIGGIVDLMVD